MNIADNHLVDAYANNIIKFVADDLRQILHDSFNKLPKSVMARYIYYTCNTKHWK